MGNTEVMRPAASAGLACVLIFAMAFPTLVAWLYFVALAEGGGGTNWVQQVVYSAGKVVQFSLPLVFLWFAERRLPRLRRPGQTGLVYGLGFGLLVAGLMLGAYYAALRHSPMLAQTPQRLRQRLSEFGITTLPAYLALSTFIVLLHSLLEEYYWRWFVFGWLRKLLPVTIAAVLASLAFMSHHVVILYVYMPGRFWNGVVPFSLGIAVGGMFWCWLYQRTDSLYAAWLSHLLIDAAIFAIGWDLLERSAVSAM
jgi:membrane protease YdiL (CAAX protease family)